MTSTILIRRSDLVANTNNSTYRYYLKQNTKFEKEDEIGLYSADIWFSWVNISKTLYNNASFQYQWFGATDVSPLITYDIEIPDGYYSVADLQEFIVATMYGRKHYIYFKSATASSSTDYYYITLEENATAYAIQISCLAMPLPSSIVSSGENGYQNPSIGQTGLYPEWVVPSELNSNRCPKVIINSTNNFGDLLGFSSGVYPPDEETLDTAILSDLVPQMTPVSSVLITCNLVDNVLSDPNNVIYSFSGTGLSYGSQIQLRPNFLQYYQIKPSMYNFIEIKFYDQDYTLMSLKDPDILITLAIKKSK